MEGPQEAPLTADTISLPPPDAASGRRRQRSVQAVSACRGAEAAAIHLDDGHVALLTYESRRRWPGFGSRRARAPRARHEHRWTTRSWRLSSSSTPTAARCPAVVLGQCGRRGPRPRDDTTAVDRSSPNLEVVVGDDGPEAVLPQAISVGVTVRSCAVPHVHLRDAISACARRADGVGAWSPSPGTPSPRRHLVSQARARALQARRAGGPRGAAAAETTAQPTEKVIDVAAESDEDEESASKLRQGARATQQLLRESRAAHDEDLRRADRRFEEEKRLRKEWNDARRASERRLDDAHAALALLETEYRGGDRHLI